MSTNIGTIKTPSGSTIPIVYDGGRLFGIPPNEERYHITAAGVLLSVDHAHEVAAYLYQGDEWDYEAYATSSE